MTDPALAYWFGCIVTLIACYIAFIRPLIKIRNLRRKEI